MAQGAGVGTGSIDRSVMFRLLRANSQARIRSGFRREKIHAAIGLVRDGGVRKFLLDLLVDAGGFFGVGSAKDAGKFQQYHRPRHEDTRFIRQSAEDFDGIIGLAGAGINYRHLILRHGRELFVAAAADFFQLLERLIVVLEALEAKRLVVTREFSGLRAGILVGHLGELLHGVLRARGLIGIERLVRTCGIRTSGDAALVSLRGGIQFDGRGVGLALDIEMPAGITERSHQKNNHDNECELPVRDNGFGAVLDGFLDFVLLQFFARNMVGHARSPEWSGTCNRNIRCRAPAGSQRRFAAQAAAGRSRLTVPTGKYSGRNLGPRIVLILKYASGLYSLRRGTFAEGRAV